MERIEESPRPAHRLSEVRHDGEVIVGAHHGESPAGISRLPDAARVADRVVATIFAESTVTRTR